MASQERTGHSDRQPDPRNSNMAQEAMDMGGMTMATGATKMGGGMHMGDYKMWMWFHTELNDTILFEGWRVKTAGMMVVSCIGIFFMALFLDLIKFLRYKADKAMRSGYEGKGYFGRLFSGAHFLQTLLFAVQTVFGYLVMLVFMNFSVWVCIAVIVGATVGYLIFSPRH